jgi:hypothetical protein
MNLVLIVIGLVIGLFLSIMGFSLLRRKRLIENTPTSKIRSLAIGLVEIYGKVMPEKSNKKSEEQILIAPFSGKKCVYYNVEIEEYRRVKTKEGYEDKWVVVHSSESRIPFCVKDETGSVLVNPESANIDIPITFEEDSGRGKNPDKNIIEYLKNKNLNFESFFGMNKRMRFKEISLPLNDSVYIIGDATSLNNQSEISSEKIVIKKKNWQSFFYISDKPEKEILSKLNWQSGVMIVLGVVILIACATAVFL